MDRDTGFPGATVQGDTGSAGTITLRVASEPAQAVTDFYSMTCFSRSGRVRSRRSTRFTVEGSGIVRLRKPIARPRRCLPGAAANVASGTVRLVLRAR